MLQRLTQHRLALSLKTCLWAVLALCVGNVFGSFTQSPLDVPLADSADTAEIHERAKQREAEILALGEWLDSTEIDVGSELLTHDPMGQFNNPYSYVGADPLSGVDPWGLEDMGPTSQTCYEDQKGWWNQDGLDVPSEGVSLPEYSTLGSLVSPTTFSSKGAPEMEMPLSSLIPDSWNGQASMALTVVGVPVSLADWADMTSKQWTGKNGKLYPMRWQGNRFTGPRTGAKTISAAGTLGRNIFLVSGVISSYTIYKNWTENPGVAQKAIFDLGVGAAAAYGPPQVAVLATAWMVADLSGGVNPNPMPLPLLGDKSRGFYLADADVSSSSSRHSPAIFAVSKKTLSLVRSR